MRRQSRCRGSGARPHCNTNASAGYDDTGTFEHFSLLSEIIDHIRVVGNHVRWRIGIDLVHQSRPDLEADDHLGPLARSNAGARSRTADTTPWPARMMISAAWAIPGLSIPIIANMLTIAAQNVLMTPSR